MGIYVHYAEPQSNSDFGMGLFGLKLDWTVSGTWDLDLGLSIFICKGIKYSALLPWLKGSQTVDILQANLTVLDIYQCNLHSQIFKNTLLTKLHPLSLFHLQEKFRLFQSNNIFLISSICINKVLITQFSRKTMIILKDILCKCPIC